MRSLYTIGYEGLSLERLIAVLKENCVHTLVDVRELPLSRKPGFSKTRLSEALKLADIHYVSLKALGSPRPLRHEFRETGDWSSFSSRFLEYLQGQVDVVEELAGQAHDETVCLMCFERDHTVCHRGLVAEVTAEVASDDLRVQHL